MHGDGWEVLAKELNAALDCVFVSESESTKPHYSGYSFLEALALAASGGTAPLARFVRDRQGRNILSDRHWQYLAVFIYSLWNATKAATRAAQARPSERRQQCRKLCRKSRGAIASSLARRAWAPARAQ